MFYYQFVSINQREYRLAPFGRRLLAALIDVAIVFGLLYVPFINFPLMILYLLFRDAWKPLPSFHGGSIGKWFMSIEVISLAHGQEISYDYPSSITRSLSLFVLGVDILTIFLRKDRRRYGDLAAQTVVVVKPKTDDLISPNAQSKERYIDIVNEYYPTFKNMGNEKVIFF